MTALGVDLRSLRAFPDHHAFTPGDLAGLLQEARTQGVQALVTTAKDWARLGQIWQEDLPLWVLKVAARVEPEEAWQKYLAAALGETASSCGFKRTGTRETPSPSVPQPVPPQVRRRFGSLTRKGRFIPPPKDIRRVLVRAPNWVGDAVMSLPALTGLLRLYPAAEVTVLAAPRVAPLFVGQSGVAEVIPYPSGQEKWRTLRDLRGQFDLALALPNSFESALGLWLTRTPAGSAMLPTAGRLSFP